jgi:thiamine-phosphate pyrophosphorylase
MDLDFSLYLVTDRSLSQGRSNLEIVKSAIKGGVTVVQLREKTASTREFLTEALSIRELCLNNNVSLIINDRLDIAQAVEAEGVHLGQEDMPIDFARKIVGRKMVIGISVFDVSEAVAAEKAGADYLGVSPVYTTPTKPELSESVGLDGLRKIREAVEIPLVGIGSIKSHNAAEVIKAGADGVAVVSAIVSAIDPKQAASDLIEVVRKARRSRNEIK